MNEGIAPSEDLSTINSLSSSSSVQISIENVSFFIYLLCLGITSIAAVIFVITEPLLLWYLFYWPIIIAVIAIGFGIFYIIENKLFSHLYKNFCSELTTTDILLYKIITFIRCFFYIPLTWIILGNVHIESIFLGSFIPITLSLIVYCGLIFANHIIFTSSHKVLHLVIVFIAVIFIMASVKYNITSVFKNTEEKTNLMRGYYDASIPKLVKTNASFKQINYGTDRGPIYRSVDDVVGIGFKFEYKKFHWENVYFEIYKEGKLITRSYNTNTAADYLGASIPSGIIRGGDNIQLIPREVASDNYFFDLNGNKIVYDLLIPRLTPEETSVPIFNNAEVVAVHGGNCASPTNVVTTKSFQCVITINIDSKNVKLSTTTLIVGAYNPVTWIVHNPKNIPISKVILLGYKEQKIKGLSSSTEVESHSEETDKIYQNILTTTKYRNELIGDTWKSTVVVEPNQLSEDFVSWLKIKGYNISHFQTSLTKDTFDVTFEDN